MNDYIVFPSSRSLTAIGVIAAILAPIVGVILGIYFLKRPQLVKQGRIILLVAVGWLSTIFFLTF